VQVTLKNLIDKIRNFVLSLKCSARNYGHKVGSGLICAEPQAKMKLNSYRVTNHLLTAVHSETSFISVPAVWVL
jgi:hypothetical protein